MNSLKISKKDTELIDLGDKKFYKYTSPTPDFEIKKTILNGRSPEETTKAYVESESFGIYVLKGTGKIFLDGINKNLEPEDVVYVLKNTKWSIEGDLEYIVVNVPVWKHEQMQEVGL